MDPGEDERGREVRPRVLTIGVAVAAALTIASGAGAAGQAHAADVPTGRLLVTLAEDEPATAAAAQEVAQLAQAVPAGARVPEIDLVTVRPEPGETLAATAAALRADPAVRSVEPEYRRYAFRAQTNDPALSEPESAPGTPPGTALQWWQARQGLFSTWDLTRGADARVAVIDSGIDASHPELQGKIRETASFDSRGPATSDQNGHGTHVASIACAAGDNGTGIVGAGLDCGLIVIRTDLTDSSVARSIVEAVNRGAHAINMSFGTDGDRPASRAVAEAIDFAVGRDVVLVAAAADQAVEEQGDPANVLQPSGSGPDITQGRGLSVTSASFSGARSSFAGRGSQISMAAYGSFDDRNGPPGILGAFPANETEVERGTTIPLQPGCGCRTSVGGDPRYAYLQGTSMAAPMVAATAALVRVLNPDLSAAEVVRVLKQSARRAPGGWTPEVGWGILDGGSAASTARTIDRRAPVSRVRAPRTVRRARTITLRWSGSDPAPAGLAASGVRLYEVYRSANGGAYRRIARTRRTSQRLRVRPGSRYRFYTRAVDVAGNREAVPRGADATTRVSRTAGR